MVKKILISYFGYEHDQLKHKIQDKEFLRRFGKDSKTQGYLLDKDPADIKRTDIWRPSVALASYPNLHFDEYYLLFSGLKGDMHKTFNEVVEDIQAYVSAGDAAADEAVAYEDFSATAAVG